MESVAPRARVDADDHAISTLVEHSGARREQGTAGQVKGRNRGFRAGRHRGSMS
jgi:hypothetical protein